ncbi:MAG: type IX secretion system sortase PorU [Ignavibacteriales bacterium]|nr:type IX secretion system sortase PorU [Ignavibacteriales bacterium]
MMSGKLAAFFSALAPVIAFAQLGDATTVVSTPERLVFDYRPAVVIDSLSPDNASRLTDIRGCRLVEERDGTLAYVRSFLIGTPTETGATLEAVGYDPVEYDVASNDERYADAFEYADSLDLGGDGVPGELVSFGAYREARGAGVQTIVVRPVLRVSSGRARVYSRVRVSVTFPDAPTNVRPNEDPLIDGVVLNADVAKRWRRSSATSKPARVSSVLASGTWYRFEAPETGMYKIERDELSRFGIDPTTVDPRTIKIYNNGGKELPEDIDAERPFDLVECAVQVSGEEDGSFDEGDYVLFFGRGAVHYDYNETYNVVGRFINDFSNRNYYWITSGGALGKRMQDVPSMNDPAALPRTTTKAYDYVDEDKINLGNSGRLFLGDEFSSVQPSRTYETVLERPVPGDTTTYRFHLVNATTEPVDYRVTENGTTIRDDVIGGFNPDNYLWGTAEEFWTEYTGAFPNDVSRIEIAVSGAESFFVYLDFIHIIYRRLLDALDDEIVFFSRQTEGGAIAEYRLSGFSHDDIRVFDVSDYSDVAAIVSPIKRADGEFRFQALERDSTIRQYAACTPERFKTPINPEPVANQDLKGTLAESRFIIVTHPYFRTEAERLATHKESLPAPISSVVVDVDEIYNEFSCGSVDPSAIRYFLKYCYDLWTVKPEYVLLFGDATFDYRDMYGKGLNFVPTYETVYSLGEINSYPTDDYFVDLEGTKWTADMAIGRAPVRSLSDARAFVDKAILYETASPRDSWRNRAALVADDQIAEGKRESILHSHQSESLEEGYLPSRMEVRKIYLAAYPTAVTGAGLRKPAANRAIIDAMNEGAVVLNFYGHGNSELWTHEQVYVSSSSLGRNVTDRFFFLTAATCGFGDFDKLEGQSGAEQMALKSDGGSIGSITASRPVFPGENQRLNERFYGGLFQSGRDTLNLPYPAGRAYYQTKLAETSENSLKFSLLGDPTVRLAFPQYEATIDSINGALSGTTATMRALGTMRIEGTVRKSDGSKWSEFSGEGRLSVFDSDYETPLPEVSSTFAMNTQGGAIFNGRVSITDGEFSASFVAPKDLSQSGEKGKVVFYFADDDVDGLGYSDEVIVSGVNASAIDDGEGPEIEITFDDPAFDGARLANRDATLVATISDETGVNTSTAGVGHLMKAVIDGDEANPIPLGDRFIGDLDAGGKSGVVEYPLVDLEPGRHSVRVDAYDVFNNLSSRELEFEVVETGELTLKNVMNYPNPTAGATVFTFQHNYSSPLDVTVSIFTVAGRKIRELTASALFDRFARIRWDGRDDNGDPLANGVYLYKITAKTIDGEESESVLGKLAIAR